MESGVVIVDLDDSGTRRRLASMIASLAGGRGAGLMRAVGYRMRARTLQKFTEERGPEGHWKPLQQATVDRRRKGDREGRADKILQDTGRMKGSIHSVAERDSVDIGTPVVYSPFHQFGAPRAGIPERPFLYVDAADAANLESLALAYLERSLQ
jgi:phage virion morphogenesis protein